MLIGLLLLACLSGIAVAAPAEMELDLPPVPADENFIQDYAALLPAEAKTGIGRLQKEAFEDDQTPIIVVTITSMSDYGGRGYSIERFAAEWFNHWQIGVRGPAGELVNRGILLLISRDDRQARIELGADWGRRWDSHANRIMQNRIVPRFRGNDYPEGIVTGVEALRQMAALGPDGQIPGAGSRLRSSSFDDPPLSTSPLPMWAIALAVLVGLTLIALSFVIPQYRKWLLISGIVLILAAIIFWIVVVVILTVMKFTGRSNGGGGSSFGGFSGGGFGSGGFSGGGGASGSW